MSGVGVVDVHGVVAVTEDIKTAGAIVWWRLSGTTDSDALRVKWAKAGFDPEELPSPPGPATALLRACRAQREQRTLVRPLGRGTGFALVNEHVHDENGGTPLDHDIAAIAKVDDIGRVTVTGPGRTMTMKERDALDKIRTEVVAGYERHLETLSAKDISLWLVDFMPKLDAVSLRDKGGVYFVPHHNVARLEAIADCIASVSGHRVHRVPALKSEDAVNAILDAIDTEASAEAEAMESDIAAAALGARGFEHRVGRCEEIEAKVVRYETLLGRKLDALGERLVNLRHNLTVAMIKSRQAQEGQVALANV